MVLRVRMVIPPVLAAKTNNGFIVQHHLRRLALGDSTIRDREVRTACGPGSPSGQPAWGGGCRRLISDIDSVWFVEINHLLRQMALTYFHDTNYSSRLNS